MKKGILVLVCFTLFFVLSACDINLIPPSNETVIDTLPVDNIEPVNFEPFERLFNDDIKKSLTIVITQQEWNALDQKMVRYYQKFGNYRTDEYAKANLIFEDEEGIVEIPNIGFRTRGNLSRVRLQDSEGNLNLSHFKISFKEHFNQTSLAANKKRTVFGLEEIDMKYNRNWDSSYITEKFSYDLFREFGVYAPYATLAKVYIQINQTKHFYGLYTLIEPIDEKFLERRLPIEQTDGNLYKSLWQQYGPASLQQNYQAGAIGIKDESINYRPAYDLKTNKKKNDTTDLVTFIDNLNHLSGIAFKNYIRDAFDVDRLLRLLAVGVLLGNPDDYRAMGNNYYLYHNPVLDQWTMIPYDYDHGLGQGWDGFPVFQNYTVGADIYEWGNLNAQLLGRSEYAHPLTDKILADRGNQILYETYLSILIDPTEGFFSFEAFYAAYDKQKQLYKDDVSSAMMNLGFGRRNTEWYFNAKVEDILSQLQYYQDHPWS